VGIDMKYVILAGPTRTGTTSLFRFVAQDPQVCASRKKETNYFLMSALGDRRASAREYDELFDKDSGAVLRLEASPMYFLGGRRVAHLVDEVLGDDVQVVFTLRDPVERFVSLYLHIISKRNIGTMMPFERFVEECLSFHPSRFHSFEDMNHMSYQEGNYVGLLGEWFDVLGRDRVKVVFYENLVDRRKGRASVTDLLDWIGISKGSPLREMSLLHENRSRMVRFPRAHALAMAINDLIEPILDRNQALRDWMRDIYYRFNESGASKSLGQDIDRSVLVSAYRTTNRGLPQLLDGLTLGDLPAWVAELK